MLDRLRRIAAECGVELSDEELLDTLWLARRLPRNGETALARAVRYLQSSSAASDAAPPPAAAGEAMRSADASTTPNAGRTRQSGQPLHATSASGVSGSGAPYRGGWPALPVRTPGGRMLGGRELRLGRALRPLKQRLLDRRRQELDVEGTVTVLAETGLPDTVLRPVRTRWLTLALVVDDGVSMLLWQRLAAEMHALMKHAGAFRGIRVYGLDSRSSQAPALRSRPYEDRGVSLPPAIVNDPSGSTLVLVVSDGIGTAWCDGRMRTVVEAWARQGPTAIVHALPTRLWEGSGIRAHPWRVTTRRRGGSSSTWRVADRVLPPALVAFSDMPVPVLEPQPAAMQTWARVVASPAITAMLPLWMHEGRPTHAGTPSLDRPMHRRLCCGSVMQLRPRLIGWRLTLRHWHPFQCR
ncbi:SAV_2336 N-terminal domain-related protein [Nonomuraea sp. NPDC050227]|uniref:SAV_2336 N-terminal domain-related protein n=1 Tax=Nonomuraea sp. NPDC050227 TaxID=3364360 RepID=UPI00378EF22B